MQKRWHIKEGNPVLERRLSETLKIHPIIAKLLVSRDIHDIEKAQQFLSAQISELHDPFILKDLKVAVDRIYQAKQNAERVLIFGDYDVDGITSSVILSKLLKGLGLEVVNHIPHRMTDGYGLNMGIVEVAKSQNIKLIIAVDCGTSSHEEIKALKSAGIDVIVIDHHEPPEGERPHALAMVNPKQKTCSYPFKDLASAGLVAKLAQALHGKIEDGILALAAVGTVSDVALLRGENRIFVKHGLSKLHETQNKGILALLEVAKIKGKKVSPFHVGFIIGPRLNAAGRMDTAHVALDLLMTEDSQEALRLAKILDDYNLARQKTQKDIISEAIELVDQEINFSREKVIVLNREGWHKGVLGIVASRLREKYYRPAIVISTKDGVGTASARSIDGFHIQEALEQCSQHLESFGGHKGAAGLTIRLDKIDPFRSLINEVAEKTIGLEDLMPSIAIDSEIPFSNLTLDLVDMIAQMEPFGEGNPEPVFCSRHLMVKSPAVVLGKDTLKFWVTDGQKTLSAVGFGMAEYKPLIKVGQPIDLAYQLTIDDWNKAPTLQLKLKDVKATSGV